MMPVGPTIFPTHLKRAFDLKVAGQPTLADEKRAVADKSPRLARVLVWRRSLLFVALLVLAPMLIFNLISTIALTADDTAYGFAIGMSWILFFCSVALTGAVLYSFLKWDDWETSRKTVLRVWLVDFLAPFLLFLLPLAQLVPGVDDKGQLYTYGLYFALMAVVRLGPRVLALVPGVVRTSLTTKMLFPGSTAPGWLLALAVPVTVVIFYVLLNVSYQLTTSPLFLLSMMLFVAAPLVLWRLGRQLARPLTEEQALASILRVRLIYTGINGLALLLVVIGVAAMDFFSVWQALDFGLAFLAHGLIITLVGTDLAIGAIRQAQQTARDATAAPLAREHEQRVDDFFLPRGAAARSGERG